MWLCLFENATAETFSLSIISASPLSDATGILCLNHINNILMLQISFLSNRSKLPVIHRSHCVDQTNKPVRMLPQLFFLYGMPAIVVLICSSPLFTVSTFHSHPQTLCLCHHSEWVLIRRHHLVSCLSRYEEYLPKIALACNYPGD